MTSPLGPLLGTSLRTWLSAKGFWLVAAAALVPLVFTGAWVGAHRADVTAQGLTIPDGLKEGDAVTFRATIANTGPRHVGPFNATFAVGTVTSASTLTPTALQTIAIDGLDPGQSKDVTLDWNATGGVYYVVAFADQEDVVGEVDEYDNQDAKPISVPFRPGGGVDAPTPPPTVNGNETSNETADFAITALTRGNVEPGVPTRLEAVVENHGSAAGEVNVSVRALQIFQGAAYPTTQTQTALTLQPGESRTVTLNWTPLQGAWWQEAYVEPPAGTKEATPEDNHKAEPFSVDVQLPSDLAPPKIPEKQTIKDFYLGVLDGLHFRILLPLVALFYAGGVIADERDRGALAYVLTRPFPRGLIPVTKFLASFLVAAVAVVVGVVLTYLLLFGFTPQGDIGFLITPLLVALLTLFAYGALFTLIGVWYPRPYLIGIAWILGWEIAAYTLVPWIRNLTVRAHVENALNTWPMDQGALWLPTGEGGTRAILVLLLGSVALLVAASVAMKRREFEV